MLVRKKSQRETQIWIIDDENFCVLPNIFLALAKGETYLLGFSNAVDPDAADFESQPRQVEIRHTIFLYDGRNFASANAPERVQFDLAIDKPGGHLLG
jgi:hypothetical protein